MSLTKPFPERRRPTSPEPERRAWLLSGKLFPLVHWVFIIKEYHHPDIDSSERPAMFALVDKHPDTLRPMIGLYPGSVGEGWKAEVDDMVRFLDRWEAETRRKVVAVGEIGLDYHEGKEFAREQKEALEWQLDFAARRGLPVNIHLRDAMGDFLEMIRRHKGLRGNMHA